MINYVGKEKIDWRRGSPEKINRNAAVIELYLLGNSYRRIGSFFGVHYSRIWQIVKRFNKEKRI